MPLRETILQMQVRLFHFLSLALSSLDWPFLRFSSRQVFDEIRKQGNFRYPKALETLELN
jgi:hypothetical protein